MSSFSLDDRGAVFAFRGVMCLVMILFLVHSRVQELAFSTAAFLLAGLYLTTSVAQWRLREPRLHTPGAQAAAFLWDIAVVAGLVYFSEGFDEELYLMFFLILFMSALLTEIRHAFLIGGVASLLYLGLWAKGKAAVGLPEANLGLRFAFFFTSSFFAAVMAARARGREKRLQNLDMRLALDKLANGGWSLRLDEDVDPEVAKSVRVVNAVLGNMEGALKRLMEQNEQLREAAHLALVQLAREKERIEALDETFRKKTLP